jgi:hypothetical protein
MQVRHRFPPPQRRYGCRRHAADVRRFLGERGIGPRGGKVGDRACGTGLPRSVFAALAERRPAAGPWHMTGMIARPSWLSLFTEKTGG